MKFCDAQSEVSRRVSQSAVFQSLCQLYDGTIGSFCYCDPEISSFKNDKSYTEDDL